MLIKNIAILGSSLLLLGCANWLAAGFPEFPKNITSEHLIVIQGEKAFCFKLEIVSFFPRKLGDPVSVPLSECNELGGLLPDEALAMDNWMEKVYKFGKENKCYKQ